MQDFIPAEFSGISSYRTTCTTCKTTSATDSPFYEIQLTLQKDSTLASCLQQFLTPEVLSGRNMYACSTCKDKRQAERAIELKKLPNVLTFQLMRFYFNGKTQTREKNSAAFTFPECIDMAAFLPASATAALPQDARVYDLHATLLHLGGSTTSGHYIAHVLDPVGGNWLELNDDVAVILPSDPVYGASIGEESSERVAQLRARKRKRVTDFATSDIFQLIMIVQCPFKQSMSPE